MEMTFVTAYRFQDGRVLWESMGAFSTRFQKLFAVLYAISELFD